MDLRIAQAHDFSAVQDFYWRLIDLMKSAAYKPAWEKGIYPSDDFLRLSIQREALYTLWHGGAVVAAMVLNHDCAAGYEKIPWQVTASQDEILVIHALGILPAHQGQGFASFMVRQALLIAKESGQKAVRLDVLCGNLPAQKLYERIGFTYRGSIQLFYEDTGLTDFLLYEYPLAP